MTGNILATTQNLEILMQSESFNLSEKELLIRIDERQRQMSELLQDVRHSLLLKVENNEEYHELQKKVDSIWDWKNKITGYAIAAGAAAGLVMTLIERFVFSKILPGQ